MSFGNGVHSVSSTHSSSDTSPGQAAIEAWLVAKIAELIGGSEEAIEPDALFDSFGLASRDAVALSGDLEDWLRRRLSPTLIYEYPTIASLARHLGGGEQVAVQETPPLASDGTPQRADEPLAIVGIGCRFPEADGPAAFWELLRRGGEPGSGLPPERAALAGFAAGDPAQVSGRQGRFLSGVDAFDAHFFGISPREARRMDPQQRILLEVAWEALEHAGLAAERVAGSEAGVFVGISGHDYAMLQLAEGGDAYTATGSATSIAANRISYTLDLHGPSVAVDTACSSSLVALHLACRSLRGGETNLALVGGVNLILTPELTESLHQAQLLSPEGRSKAFDASADGYARGEGCGVVVLKRLADATRDGDRVLALVRGTAANHDGHGGGLSAPSARAQTALIHAALRDAGVTPEQIDYVETHGAGTFLGDAVEARALGAVMVEQPRERSCLIGSVKTNLGSLEAAAGMAGLIKTVLSLTHEMLPPHLHLETVSPQIPLGELGLEIVTAARPWPKGERRRLAGVSAFGLGGSNAHAIIEEAPEPVVQLANAERQRHVLALSARDETALQALVARVATYTAGKPELALADVCYSANTGRNHFARRLAVSAGDRSELLTKLAEAADTTGHPTVRRQHVAFRFGGELAPLAELSGAVYESEPLFRAALDRCGAILAAWLDRPLLAILRMEQPTPPAEAVPAICACEYALAQLWTAWGVCPDYLLGNSVGEYAAAAVCGAVSLEDALRLAITRGRMLEEAMPAAALDLTWLVPATLHRPATPTFISTVSGHALQPEESLNATYWGRQLREPAQLPEAMETLYSAGCTLVLTLAGSALVSVEEVGAEERPAAGSAPGDAWTQLLESLAELYAHGVAVDWVAFDRPYARRRVDLPTYPFQRERFWIEATARSPGRNSPSSHTNPLLGRRIDSPLAVVQFEAEVSGAMLAAHEANSARRHPAPVFEELARAAVTASFGTPGAVELAVHAPLRLNDEVRALQTLLTPQAPGDARVEVFSRPLYGDGWSLHASGRITYSLPAELPPEAAAAVEFTRGSLLELPVAERQHALASFLHARAAEVLQLPPARLGLDEPLTGMGLDSIMALELKMHVERSLGLALPLDGVLVGQSVATLAGRLLDQLDATSTAPPLPAGAWLEGEPFPLSYGQRALWVQHQLAPASVFNPVYAARLRAALDVERLRGAFQAVLDRHPALRATFGTEGGEPVQVIRGDQEIAFLHEYVPGLPAEAALRRLNDFARQPFDLEQGPLFRVYVLSIGPEEHLLALASHHLVTDLWSHAIIASEVGRFYETPALAELLPRPALQPADYVAWEHEMLASPVGEARWHYWRTKLAGELPLLNLPTARPRPAVQSFGGDSRTLILGAELTSRLRATSERYGATLYATMLAAFDVLLFRYTGQSDIIVGTAANGRSQAAMAEAVGYFVNSLPVRASLGAGQPFSALLDQVRQSVSEAVAHQEFPLALLVERLRPARDISRTPLFQVMFVFQRTHLLREEGLGSFAVGGEAGRLKLGQLSLESVELPTHGSPFDMTLMMVEDDQRLRAEMTFNRDLFDGEAIERMLAQLATLLDGVASDPETPIDRLPLLPSNERRQVVEQFNATDQVLPIDQPIHALFEDQVARNPQAVAVVACAGLGGSAARSERRELSYAELNARANQLAHSLRERGVRPDHLVGIMLDRSIEMVVAVLGVLKAGGAYVPIDPAYPQERIQFMLADAKPRALLTTAELALRGTAAIEGPGQPAVVRLDTEWPLIATCPDANLEGGATARDLAYVIYTSGSTGRPKGVMIEHRGLCNLVLSQIAGFGVTAASRVLQFASFSFDASVSELFMALISGGQLFLAGRETLLSSTGLARLLHEEAINTVTLPPSLLALLRPEELSGLQTLISAGEALPVDQARRWSSGRRLFNAYGPTESTIGPTFFDTSTLAPDATVVPIGRPINNTQLFILDANGQPTPLGVPGEIYLGGAGLARGYLDRSELTAERFVTLDGLRSTDANQADASPTRLYRTGDLARLRPDGNVEYLGRIDRQVKIRGLRIELGEIEGQLRAHPAVRDVCVVAREDRPGDTRLVAYVVAREPEPGSLGYQAGALFQDLRAHLQAVLPDYMIPGFVALDTLPLTPNGKVDQRALPAPGVREATAGDMAPPQSELEQALARLWSEALGVERVGRNDNFFELGGHSLLLVKVHGQLEELLGREVAIVELFRFPTIGALARHLSRETETPEKAQANSVQRAAQQRAALQQQRVRAVGEPRRSPSRD